MRAPRPFSTEGGRGANAGAYLVFFLTMALAAAVRFAGMTATLPDILHSDEPTNEGVILRVARHPGTSPRFFSYPSLLFYTEAAVLRAYEFSAGVRVTPARILVSGTARTGSPGWWVWARTLSVLVGGALAGLASAARPGPDLAPSDDPIRIISRYVTGT